MPPPPPPSKSYLLVIDDSSDEGEDFEEMVSFDADDNVGSDDEEAMEMPFVMETMSNVVSGSTPVSPDSSRSDSVASNCGTEETGEMTATTTPTSIDEDDLPVSDIMDDEDEFLFQESTFASSAGRQKKKKQQKKKQKKKANKKNKKGAAQQTQAALKVSKVKECRFGTVSVHEFNRCLGLDGVPGDGGWPLGIDFEEQTTAFRNITVDEYESHKQARLLARWKEWVKSNNDDDSTKLDPPAYLETRQFDYYSSDLKNPLFGKLGEKERMKLLISYSSGKDTTDCIPPPSSPPDRSMADRKHSSNSNNNKSHARSRKSSFTGKSSFVEEYNDTFPQLQVHHVRNELETIRNYRSLEGGAGCSCRKLQVYLLPAGGGGKKAHSRRMSVPKLKEELRKRHLLPPQDSKTTREELELILYNAVEQEPCCSIYNDDCTCVKNELECQADTCSCWLNSHQAKTPKHKIGGGSSIEISEIKSRCGNKYGMYAVDLDQVNETRNIFLQQQKKNNTPNKKTNEVMYCQEISSAPIAIASF